MAPRTGLGFAVFVLGSLLCALAWNKVSIIAFRIVQGVSGALIMASSGAVIADLYPRERRGRAYGFTSVGWTIGAVAELPLSLFRVPTMTASLLAAMFQGLAPLAVLFRVLVYLQGPRGLSPIHASLLLVPGYVAGGFAGPVTGRRP